MAIQNSGTGVVVTSGGCNLNQFKAVTNVKTIANVIHNITSGTIGAVPNGAFQLSNINNTVADLSSNNTIICTQARLVSKHNGISPTGTYVNLSGVKLILTQATVTAENTIPIKGDNETQIVYLSKGTTWNSASPDTNIDGSTIIFHADGDGHLSYHPNATVKNVNLVFKQTTDSEFVLGMHQNWSTNNVPIPIDNLEISSLKGNTHICFFTFNDPTTPANLPNNAFGVIKDLTYNVAKPGGQPIQSIRRAYRRRDFNATINSSVGSGSINPTYLWIDPKTTLNNQLKVVDTPTYIREINYLGSNTASTDNASDVIVYRYSPLVVDENNNPKPNVQIAAFYNETIARTVNTYDTAGKFNIEMPVIGYTGTNGKFHIQMNRYSPQDSSDHKIRSILILNRTRQNHWFKYDEENTKFIPVYDSRNSTGSTLGMKYDTTNMKFYYRCRGYKFLQQNVNIQGPYSPVIQLEVDHNYNDRATTDGITVEISNRTQGKVRVNIAHHTVSLDQVYKAVYDWFLSNIHLAFNFPLRFDQVGVFAFNSTDFQIVGTGKITQGEKITRMSIDGQFDKGEIVYDVPYSDSVHIGAVKIIGTQGDTVQLRRNSDNSVLTTSRGDGSLHLHRDWSGVQVYAARVVDGLVVSSSKNKPFTVKNGDNGLIQLYAGDEIQLADSELIQKNLKIINDGIKNSSLLIPHTTSLL